MVQVAQIAIRAHLAFVVFVGVFLILMPWCSVHCLFAGGQRLCMGFVALVSLRELETELPTFFDESHQAVKCLDIVFLGIESWQVVQQRFGQMDEFWAA